MAPSFLCLAVYWLGLKAWFQQDDFAWLHLRYEVHGWSDFWSALFAPMAQGTIRPWSERAFFMAFSSVFGLHPLPFRMWVFLTQFASLILLSWIAWRLTGSRAAGFCAPVFWMVNPALAKSMSWTSAYNEILCGFFLLASFALLLRYIETGRRKYYAAQWGTFLLGFGALELNVVYPALAAAYTFCCARKRFRETLPMFVPALGFIWLHQRVAPAAGSGVYGMYYDAGVLASLKTYWEWALGPAVLATVRPVPPWLVAAGTAALSVALLGFAAWKLRRRAGLAAFLPAWFVIVLAPLLPLQKHVTEYYLTLPVIGLALLGAWAFAEALRGRQRTKAAAVLLAAVYLGSCVRATRGITWWHYDRSHTVRDLVLGAVRARQLHPGKTILLTGVNTDLFWSGIFDRPFRLFGVGDIFLAPGSEAGIQAHPEYGEISDYMLPAELAVPAVEQGRAVVYAAGGGRLRNVTMIYRPIARSQWKPEVVSRVDVGDPRYAGQLGPTWYTIEDAHRWMPKRATVRLRGPTGAGQRLYIAGYCPAALLQKGLVSMRVGLDGRAFPTVVLSQGDAPFHLTFRIPSEAVGRPSVEVSVEVDRTLKLATDPRDLGVVFGTFEIR